MMDRVVRFLRGAVRVRAAGRGAERALNLCAVEEIPFWDVRRTAPDAVTFRVSRRDWVRLRQAAEAVGIAVEPERNPHGPETAGRAAETEGGPYGADSETAPDGGPSAPTLSAMGQHGAPSLLGRFFRRRTLAVSLIVCATALFLGSFFIWDFQVTGNRTVPTERILRALERQGVGLGSFGLSLDGQDLRNHVLLDIPELSWLTVNVSGCRAIVQVRERVVMPDMVEEAVPANVTARRSGLITRVRALDGAAQVVPGMAAEAGDLLISGTEDLDTLTGGTRTMAARGSVRARTWYNLTTTLPLSGTEKRYTGEESRGYSFAVGRRRFPLYSNRRFTELADGVSYDKTVERHRWTLLGIPLPLAAERETVRFYEAVPAARTVAQAKDRGEAALMAQLVAEVEPYGEIRSTLCTVRRRGDAAEVTLAAECEEEIGVAVAIEGENTAD